MKTFRMIGMALVAVMLGFAMSACSDDDDDYLNEVEKEYSRLIVGKWFNFSPDASVYTELKADGTLNQVGYGAKNGWREYVGTYEINGNKVTSYISGKATPDVMEIVELTNEKYVTKFEDSRVHTNYRVKEQFDITGKYTYLNSAVRVEAATGKTEMKLPEGITFGGKNTISVEAMKGDRIVE